MKKLIIILNFSKNSYYSIILKNLLNSSYSTYFVKLCAFHSRKRYQQIKRLKMKNKINKY